MFLVDTWREQTGSAVEVDDSQTVTVVQWQRCPAFISAAVIASVTDDDAVAAHLTHEEYGQLAVILQCITDQFIH